MGGFKDIFSGPVIGAGFNISHWDSFHIYRGKGGGRA